MLSNNDVEIVDRIPFPDALMRKIIRATINKIEVTINYVEITLRSMKVKKNIRYHINIHYIYSFSDMSLNYK